MKKLLILSFLTFFMITINPDFAFSINYPSPIGYVNDFADIIPSDMEERIRAKISEYEKQTSIEIAVVTTNSLDGLPANLGIKSDRFSLRPEAPWSLDLAPS